MYVCVLFAIVICLAFGLIMATTCHWSDSSTALITAHILGLLIFFSGCMFSTNVLKLLFEVVNVTDTQIWSQIKLASVIETEWLTSLHQPIFFFKQ